MVLLVFSSIVNFLKYWYFRYLLITELYMLELWERSLTNIFVVLLAITLSYFNSRVVLNAVSSLTKHYLSDTQSFSLFS